MIKRQGEWRTFAAKNFESALTLSKSKIRNTAAASFKIQTFTGKTVDVNKFLGPQFRRSKSEPNVFVQRRSFRIGSIGEKQDITFKGIQASKSSKKRRRRFLL